MAPWPSGYGLWLKTNTSRIGRGFEPAFVLGVESLGKALNTNFLVLSETDVKFGGPMYLLSAVHVKNPLVVLKIVEE